MERILQAAEIGPPRCKADHGDAVIAGDVPRHDFVRRGAERLGDVLKVDAMLAAIDDGDAPSPRILRWRNRLLPELGEFLAQRIEINLRRIVVNQQGSIGRHGFGHAGDWLTRQRTVEREHPPARGVIDRAAEFYRDGAVTTWQKAGRGEDGSHGFINLRLASCSNAFCCEVEFGGVYHRARIRATRWCK